MGVDRRVADGRWLSIGEACRVVGISRTTLLAAEDAGLLTPMRTPGGHRRYAAAELQRYLGAAGADPGLLAGTAVPDRVDGRPPAVAGPASDPELAATVRAAVRPLAHALAGESAGLYLTRDGAPGPAGLRFAGAFGIPRWLAERLTGGPPPAEVAAALPTVRARLFDPAATGFPDPRSTGHGAVAGLHADGHPLGVLFVVTRADHDLLPGELRMLEAFAEVLALLVAARLRSATLAERLHSIAALCTPGPRP